ncbi:LamG domain-containing protein [Opitutaceae bacterium TAV4]|nr:LamG domain-containing protein [Opitutaceae bacterium TAV4]RRK02459.1 LamG domain-containing protein [Opitutaceae bacterium TAV3]
MKNQNLRTLLILTSLGLAAPAAIAADTIGWWRFEDSANLGKDSSGNGLNLTVNSTPSQVATPFGSTVPQTGDTNTKALNLTANTGHYLSTPDSATFNFQSFTFETYLRLDAFQAGNNAVIGGQWDSSLTSGKNWSLFVNNSDRELRLRIGNPSSEGYSEFKSGIQLTLGDNYYIAITVTASGTSSGTSGNFYIQNLSEKPKMDMDIVPFSTTGIRTLNTASTASFALGVIYENGAAPNSGKRNFGGIIDEVRLTNGVLAQDQLLGYSTIPEPATWAMLAAGLILALTLIIRRYR